MLKLGIPAAGQMGIEIGVFVAVRVELNAVESIQRTQAVSIHPMMNPRASQA